MNSSKFLFVLPLLFHVNAFAIVGDLLPNSELPNSICKLTAEKWLQGGVTTENKFFCSAVLVDQNTLYSAGHCHPAQIESLLGVKISGSIKVECGKTPTPETTRMISSDEWKINPLFNAVLRMDASQADLSYDFSIIKLSTAITAVRPVDLVSSDYDQTLKIAQQNLKRSITTCRSFGFGGTDDEAAGNLHGAITPIVTMGPRTFYSDMLSDKTTQDHVYRIRGVGGTTYGDSGGALICKDLNNHDVLLGIISRGERTFSPHVPAIANVSKYTNISFNKSWLDRMSKDFSAEPSSYIREYVLEECNKVVVTSHEALNTYKKVLKKTKDYKELKTGLEIESKRLNDATITDDTIFEVYDHLYYLEKEIIRIGRNLL